MISRLKRFFLDLSIRGKLLLFFIFASLLPLLFISIYSYSETRQRLLEQAYENMYNTNSQMNNNIENRLASFQQVSSLLFMDSTLREYLTKKYHRDMDFVEAYDYINNLMYGVMMANKDIYKVTLYTENLTIPSDGLFVKHIDMEMKEESWYRQITQSYGNSLFSVIKKDGDMEPIFTLARLLNYNYLNYSYGALTIDVKEDVLYSLMEKETRSKDMYIVNQEGIILSTQDKALITTPLADLIGSGPWQESGDGNVVTEIEGERSLVVFNSMGQGWKTVSVVPLTEVLANTRVVTNRIILISASSVLFAMILIVLTTSYFSGRFQMLYRFIRKVENEEFSAVIPTKSKDELGRLSEAFNAMSRRLSELINEVYKKEIIKKEAELNMLQSQINPHFLYNTLSIISSSALRNKDTEVEKIVDHLSSFYKTTLNKGKRNITIEKELDITRHYIAIQQMRFGELFQVHWQLDESLLPYQTLKLMLQPFVENAIHHAIWDDESPLNIIIRLYKTSAGICFEVVDDGAGIKAEQLRRIQDADMELGYGISNVQQRVQLAYGQDYGVTIFSRLGVGTQVKILIPI